MTSSFLKKFRHPYTDTWRIGNIHQNNSRQTKLYCDTTICIQLGLPASCAFHTAHGNKFVNLLSRNSTFNISSLFNHVDFSYNHSRYINILKHIHSLARFPFTWNQQRQIQFIQAVINYCLFASAIHVATHNSDFAPFIAALQVHLGMEKGFIIPRVLAEFLRSLRVFWHSGELLLGFRPTQAFTAKLSSQKLESSQPYFVPQVMALRNYPLNHTLSGILLDPRIDMNSSFVTVDFSELCQQMVNPHHVVEREDRSLFESLPDGGMVLGSFSLPIN